MPCLNIFHCQVAKDNWVVITCRVGKVHIGHILQHIACLFLCLLVVGVLLKRNLLELLDAFLAKPFLGFLLAYRNSIAYVAKPFEEAAV